MVNSTFHVNILLLHENEIHDELTWIVIMNHLHILEQIHTNGYQEFIELCKLRAS